MATEPTPVQSRGVPWLTVMLALLALLAALALGAWAFWRSDTGLRWALDHVPGLGYSGLQGRPDGGPFQAEQLTWQSGDLLISVEGLAWRDLDWHWRPYAGAWLRVELVSPRARRITVKTGPGAPGGAPPQPPHDLHLPLELVVSDLEVGNVQVDDLAPIRELAADLHLGAESGRLHRIARIGLRFDPLRIQAKAEVATGGDLAASGDVRIATLPDTTPAWQAQAALAGTVARPSVDATLETATGARVRAEATLAPFAAWPLLALEASTSDLDLATLPGGLPTTRLSGRAVLSGGADGAPVQADVTLENGAPGAWNDGRLPLLSLGTTLRGRPSEPGTIEIGSLQAQLAGREEAGRLEGSGRWQGDALTLDLALDRLRPARLDERAAPMSLSGPVRLTLTGLPSPDPTAATATSAASGAPGLAGRLHAELEGMLLQPTRRPVRIGTDVTFAAPPGGALRIAVEQLELVAAPARAQLAASARRDTDNTWRLQTEGRFERFDPAAWVPGPKNSAWRRGPHRLDGNWSADLAVAQSAFASPPAALLEALRGRARLALQRSRLAGVALDGQASIDATDRTTRIEGAFDVASNHVALEGRLRMHGQPDRWTARVQAPALGALAPLAELAPAARDWIPTRGTLRLQASAEGSWPALTTQGELHAADVGSSRWQIGKADARWQGSTGRIDAPLSLTVSAADLASGEQRLDRVRASLDGSLGRHRLELSASSPLRPPAWTDTAPGAPPPSARGTQLRLDATGGWQPGARSGGSWQGHIGELRVAPRARQAEPWIAARDLDLQVRLGPDGGLVQAALEPGRMQLLGNTLQWSQARYQAAARAGAAPQMALDARLEPVEVAPWLNHLQPDFRWQGDLRIGADIAVRSAERLDAEIVIQRAGGDLSLTDEASTRAFGLTDLRLALAAHGDTWQVTEALAGSGIGVMSGAQTLRLTAGQSVPDAQTPLEGVLELRVQQLAAWNPWLPAGWRIGGNLHASAAFAGTLGTPQYRGRLEGSELGVRNMLQGIDLREGDLLTMLEGTDVRLERLAFQGARGGGRIAATGSAAFGATPRADLHVTAEKFVILGRVDRRIVMSGASDVSLQGQQIAVNGRFVVDEGLIDISQADAPHLDDDVVVVNRPVDARPAPREAGMTRVADRAAAERDGATERPPASPFRNTDVALVIDLGDDLRLRGRGLDTLLKGQLRITTPGGQLAVNGTVRLASGTYKAYGQNLTIERGVIVFSGDVSTPRLDILATRPDIDRRVGVTVQGSAVNPRVRLYSEPEMSEMDKLSWLVLGRAPSGLGSDDTALLQRAAMSLLAGENSGEGEGVLKKLGLDELSVSGVGTGDLSGAVVTVGKQISNRIFVGYERGLNSTEGSWSMIYRIARQFTLRVRSGSESAIDAIWTWRWD